MAIYAIGDVQGCYDALQALLDVIHFDENKDVLWFCGDLVNRGPRSLEVLRFIKKLGNKHQIVLGNHDLHLIAVAFGLEKAHLHDTLDAILRAPDRKELIHWLKARSLVHYDAEIDYALVHAGIPPMWTLKQALLLAKEVETVLQSDSCQDFLRVMYGNQPDYWRDDLQGFDRLRCITNAFTRMRYLHPDSRFDFTYKGVLAEKPADLTPWFLFPNRVNQQCKIVFGHFAALGGQVDAPNVFALDTGCVWGYALTAMRLGDGQLFSVGCSGR